MTPSEIDVAIQRGFDGTLTEAECLELRAVLKSDPSARALYYECAGLHQALIYRLSRNSPFDTGKSLAVARLRLQTRRSARLAMAAAAVLIFGIGLALKLIFVPAPSAATFQGAFGSRFNVEHSDSKTEAAAGELQVGATVHLTQGSLEVKLQNGSRAIVLAPATFNLQSENRMLLSQGTAWFRVSKEGHGFQVVTPELVVTDLGTEFGVRSHSNAGDEIHVFSGRVIARSLNALHGEETLSTGQARNCDPVGRFTTVRIRPEDFLTKLPVHSGTDLIANGDFEAGNHPGDTKYGSEANAALLPSWNFDHNVWVAFKTAVNGHGNGSTTVASDPEDVQVIFGNDRGNHPPTQDARIWQILTTVPGNQYLVVFEMGGAFFRPNDMEITASVHDGTHPEEGTILGQKVERRSATKGSGYNPPARFMFTATSTKTTLVFTETSPDTSSADPTIDNISVKIMP